MLDEISDAVRDLCSELQTKLIEKNPVATGWSRAHWEFFFGQDAGKDPFPRPPEAASVSNGILQSRLSDLYSRRAVSSRDWLKGATILNSVEYVGLINDRVGFADAAFEDSR